MQRKARYFELNSLDTRVVTRREARDNQQHGSLNTQTVNFTLYIYIYRYQKS